MVSSAGNVRHISQLPLSIIFLFLYKKNNSKRKQVECMSRLFVYDVRRSNLFKWILDKRAYNNKIPWKITLKYNTLNDDHDDD